MRVVKIVIITIFAVALVQIIAAEVFLRMHRFGAKEKPSWMEETIARHARNVSVPGEMAGLKNPRPTTDEDVKEAREHWVEHCSMCHGIDGRGDTTIGRSMYPQAPDMNDAVTQQKSDGELFYIISKGVRLTGMPAWEQEDSPEARWDLVSFIRHLPQLTPEELKQMRGKAGEEEESESPVPPGKTDSMTEHDGRSHHHRGSHGH